ncbi:efflux RND transporter periplasmic adaptor subunit [Desulfotignum balticum]|uniref:efflux RND transporter periplasmic adaptor subunit n=1 Tax=Desulfotignum balticum TaxID=115781 RepID=UPI00041F033B|nr:efflux RND transporter periplasmic adaptor subunit [Desulfotignum balticum]
MKLNPLLFHTRILAVMVMIFIVVGCSPEKKKRTVGKLSETTQVLVAPVTCVAINRVIAVSGTLTADKTAPISFMVPGKVDRVLVNEGDHVTRGDLLATLDATDYRNNLAIAEAGRFRAKDAFERYEPLYREGAFAETNFIELKTGLAQATAARDIARKALADTKLTAPITGIVGAKDVEIGQMVAPRMPVFTLVKTDVIYARVSVPETDIGQVILNQTAFVRIPALGNRMAAGTVSMVGAVADERTRSYPVKIELANPDYSLKPGMIVQAGIESDTAVHLLTVPGRAIVRDTDNLTYVFVAAPRTGLAQRKRVVPGQAFQSEIEIQSGLVPGDTVIISGQHKLRDGTPIIIENNSKSRNSTKNKIAS